MAAIKIYILYFLHERVSKSVLFFLLAIACNAQVKGNCFDLTPENSEFGYKQLPGRCEGFIIPKYAGILQIVSFTKGRLQYELTENTLLSVRPAVSKKSDVNVRAVSLSQNVHYQMDAILIGGQALQWPVAPYLYQRKIGAKDLGIYAWTGAESNKAFAPVIVESSPKMATPIDSLFRLALISVSDLTHFRWRFVSYDTSGCRLEDPITDMQYDDGDKPEGTVMEIVSPLFSKIKRTFCVEIRYRADSGSWLSEKLILNLGE